MRCLLIYITCGKFSNSSSSDVYLCINDKYHSPFGRLIHWIETIIYVDFIEHRCNNLRLTLDYTFGCLNFNYTDIRSNFELKCGKNTLILRIYKSKIPRKRVDPPITLYY